MTIEEALIENIEETKVYLRSAKTKVDEIIKRKSNVVKKDDTEAYNKGLNDGRNEVWELAKKLVLLDSSIGWEIFGTCRVLEVLENFTPQEAIAKLEAYEKEQEIKVGDVVTDKGHTTEILVTELNAVTFGGIKTTPTDELGQLGTVYSLMPIIQYHKTGKHIDIQSVLQQIGGTE